ncbi:Sodium channel protein type 9 subunit alpha (Peripheral sodium channel 1) (PN1) (Sodium channel protein type IX subunit alpha) (Voltage-gated sodium channel subunit alpha Nav1.7) [Durusdinium trenchii]|uniref:Sodium channel protein type 9 subunit alpha (Peripheral sodium channel 1) (PN1) (Sodium channel protein type IX subunit alpha) (Voltage-gated sodium channel subunit alpha Nav1.7) n=1 Tax=Durusdinium trenchii TaxID=1381693 RepID=A0ABP0QPL1_9DINO
MTARSSVNSCGVRLPDGRNTPIPMLAEDASVPKRSSLRAPGGLRVPLGGSGLASGLATGTVSPAFQTLLNRLVQQHLMEIQSLEVRMRSGQHHPEAPTTTTLLQEDRSAAEESEDTAERSLAGHPRASKHKVDANEILEAFEKDQDAKLLFQNADKMADGEMDAEMMKEFWARWRTMSCFDKTKIWLQSSRYEMLIALILILNVLWMAFELQFYGSISGYEIKFFSERPVTDEALPFWQSVIEIGDLFFTGFFVVDVMVRICILKLDFWRVCANYVDVAVSVTGLIEVTILYAVDFPVNPVLFRLLRIGKLARAIRMVTMTSVLGSLQLLVKCLGASCNMLFWSFCLLTFVQCVAGLIVSTLCRDFVLDLNRELALREEVFRYYGTFTRTFLTMFEILFANWGPPCRVLIENFSEWFSAFFLIYRCVLGFAVLNVVNSVFVQQTMKTASSDEEFAFKQKEKDAQMYTRKVKRLFQTIDDSGDGAINFQEFSKLVQSPKLKFWMSQLELEYHDLLSLFEFLDNGDGEITLMEFIEGAARLRGNAKALDIWRIETKMEVLIEEVLKEMKSLPGLEGNSVKLQDVFDNSMFRHIKVTTIDQVPEGQVGRSGSSMIVRPSMLENKSEAET